MRFGILLAATVMSGTTQAAPPLPVKDYAKPLDFPKEDKAEAARHFNAARKLAGEDLFVDFAHRCILDARYKQRTQGEQYNGLVEPFAAFDDLFSIGQMAVSAWALKTRDGIVLFDALNNVDEAREILVPNLRRLGLDPADVKYIVLSHSHGDHYGGAAYFQQTFGTRVIASAEDWAEMESPDRLKVPGWGDPPRRDIAVTDGQTITVGDTPLRFFVTPGHTVGTLSTIFPVHEQGRRHLVGFYGGLGLPWTPALRASQVRSLARWVEITSKAGVDSQIGNHPLHYEALERLEMLRYREPGQSTPFLVGQDRYRRYMQIQSECTRLWIARNGESQP
jgi:metallo-beta-lactamase class B